ncbi:MAG: protein-L-isoaspartate O-methyltransferase [Nanoarchaeota archaeon]
MDKTQLIELLKKEKYKEEIVQAFANVKREDFLPDHLKPYAYENMALPIGEGSAVSQPTIIALILELLDVQPNLRVLEIGSGSGYVLALLSELTSSDIYGIEIKANMAAESKGRLAGKPHVHIINKSGYNGLPGKAPFDRILVSAACTKIPKHLLSQLNDHGILVAPVKSDLIKITRSGEKYNEEAYRDKVQFVSMVEED